MKGTSFVALYRGATIASARLVAVSADPALAAEVSEWLLRDPLRAQDQVLSTLEQGRRSALRLMRKEAADASDH